LKSASREIDQAAPACGRSLDVPPVRAPPGLEAWRLEAGGDAFALFEIPSTDPDAVVLESKLTAAEIEVARMMTAGFSNADIAQKRGTALRTVANQVASIFQKLAVGSRFELCSLVAVGPHSRRNGKG
jgi:DNA-binding CsgD family transcriptional regulator